MKLKDYEWLVFLSTNQNCVSIDRKRQVSSCVFLYFCVKLQSYNEDQVFSQGQKNELELGLSVLD